jgi:hypothetical protein
MNTRIIVQSLLITGFLLATSQASALDGYKDRRGVFSGVAVGGGVGASEVDTEGQTTGLDDAREMGLTLRAELGGGYTEWLTFSGQGNWWIRTVEVGSRKLEHHHFNFLANANFFPIEILYVTGGFGLAYAAFDTSLGTSTKEYREMGFAAKAGVGTEFFVNGTVAAGVEASYTRHFYSNGYFDTISGGMTLRWY